MKVQGVEMRLKPFVTLWITVVLTLVLTLAVLIPLVVWNAPGLVNRAVEQGLASVVADVIPTVVHVKYESDKLGMFGEEIGWQGSGVIIHESGLVLTARHVVEKPGKFTVTLSDGREFVTEKACVSAKYDVGFLKIDPPEPNLPTAKFGDSDKMRLGSRILAMGSPWGKIHFNSVTLGILSSLHRGYSGEEDVSWGWEVLFQTDVAVNPGNSGGPAFNTNGEIVGIVVGMYGPGCYAGITFCVPSNICEKLVDRAKMAFALQDVMIVKADDRMDKLENWADTVENDIWNIERRLDDIEFEVGVPDESEEKYNYWEYRE